MKILFSDSKVKSVSKNKVKIAVFLINSTKTLSPLLSKLDKVNDKIIGKLVVNNADIIKSKSGAMCVINNVKVEDHIDADAVIVFHTGKPNLNALSIQKLGGTIAGKLNSMRIEEVFVYVEDNIVEDSSVKIAAKGSGAGAKRNKLEIEHFAAHLAFGFSMRNYAFNKYYTTKLEEHTLSLQNLNIKLSTYAKAKIIFENEIKPIIDGMFFARDIVSEPSNVIYPESFVQECMIMKKLGVTVKVLGEQEMKKLGMNTLLCVGQGSMRESRLLILEWNGDKKNKNYNLAFVGKGVTFDSGGISLKPSANMGDMKHDMAGAGAVVGLAMTLAMRKAKVNVVCIAGLVENMPSGSAIKPGDVVVSMSGQSIEIDNTDAEGRLVLADALWYTQKNYKPKVMVNLATLTGAINVALGDYCAGLFSNSDDLSKKLLDSGEDTGELLWRLPMSDYYDKQINSDIADIKNVGSGRGAGSITAAQFLQRFVKEGCEWAHLDIASMAWTKHGDTLYPKGATGFGVKLLNEFIIKYYENSK